MNARIQKALADARDLPIQKPIEPLPTIFSTIRGNEFTTRRQARRHDVVAAKSGMKMRNN